VRSGAPHQDIDPPEGPVRCRRRSFGLRLNGNITGLGDCTPSGGSDETRGFFRRGRIDIAAGYGRFGFGKCEADRPTDTAAGSVDERT
jgi:hypothetical protein